jgi:hypothetical protein
MGIFYKTTIWQMKPIPLKKLIPWSDVDIPKKKHGTKWF